MQVEAEKTIKDRRFEFILTFHRYRSSLSFSWKERLKHMKHGEFGSVLSTQTTPKFEEPPLGNNAVSSNLADMHIKIFTMSIIQVYGVTFRLISY